MHQRPRPRDRRGLVERERLKRLAGEFFVAAGADRTRQAFEGGGRRLVQRGPRHVDPLVAKHQTVHAGTGLRIGDIGLGARQRLHQRMGFAIVSRDHGLVEATEADCGEFAEEPGEIAEMMGRRGMRHAGLARRRAQCQARQPIAFQHPLGGGEQGVVQIAVMIRRLAGWAATPAGRPFRYGLRRPAPRAGTDRSGLSRCSCHAILYSRNFYTVKILLDGRPQQPY